MDIKLVWVPKHSMDEALETHLRDPFSPLRHIAYSAHVNRAVNQFLMFVDVRLRSGPSSVPSPSPSSCRKLSIAGGPPPRDGHLHGAATARRRPDALLLDEIEPVRVLSTSNTPIALSREWFEDVVETQRENRQLLRQGLGDAREVVERAGARVPQFLRRNRLVASRDGDTASRNKASPDK